MSKYLCTVTGKFGDALWQLATAKLIADTVVKGKVDIGLMEPYGSLIPLLASQRWIDTAAVIKEWKVQGSPYGDQPWEAPMLYPEMYEKVWHLGLRCHPGIHTKSMPLIDFIAGQQGFQFSGTPAPWLVSEIMPNLDFIIAHVTVEIPYVAYAFNGGHAGLKQMVVGSLEGKFAMVDVTKFPWHPAAYVIKNAIGFVGDRSSNKVLAHAVGQKNIICYEPNRARNKFGPFGDVFGFPYGEEYTWQWNVHPAQVTEEAALKIQEWQKEKANGSH